MGVAFLLAACRASGQLRHPSDGYGGGVGWVLTAVYWFNGEGT